LAPAAPAEPARVAVERDDAADRVEVDVPEVEDAFSVTSERPADPPEALTETDGACTPARGAFTETVGPVDTEVVAFTVAVGALTVTVGIVTVGALTGTVGALTGGGGALRGTDTVGVLTGAGGVATVTVGVLIGTDTVTEGKLSDAAGDAPASIASDPPASTPQTAILVFCAFGMRAIPNSERLSVRCGSTFVQWRLATPYPA
jgi:hypothetical protein